MPAFMPEYFEVDGGMTGGLMDIIYTSIHIDLIPLNAETHPFLSNMCMGQIGHFQDFKPFSLGMYGLGSLGHCLSLNHFEQNGHLKF